MYEYPCAYEPGNELEPYYPIFTEPAQKNYKLCQQLIRFPQIVALGRLAEYRYFDMDDAVNNALKIFNSTFYLPLISVIMPVYNGDEYVEDAVESILQQTVRDFELIIVNDVTLIILKLSLRDWLKRIRE